MQTAPDTIAFIRSLAQQTDEERIRGRLAIVGRRIGQAGSIVCEFDGSINHIRTNLLDSLERRDPNEVLLFVLEDLGADWVNVLQELVQIPAYVFGLHWMHPNDHVLGKAKTPLGQDPEQHFILNYRQPLPFRTRRRDIGLPYLNCGAKRTIVQRIRPLKELGIEDIDSTEQMVTYWRASILGRTIAVLLVDPCPDIRDQFSETTLNIADTSVPRPHPMLSEMLADPKGHTPVWPSTLEGKTPILQSQSFYDELVQFYKHSNDQREERHGKDPINASTPYGPLHWTIQCRRFVLAKAASVAQSALVETWKLTAKASTGVKRMADFDFSKLERNAWSDQWKGEFFTQLWELREDLELIRYRTELNLKVLRRISRVERSWQNRSRPNEILAAKIQQSDWDLEEWEGLLQMIDYAFKLMNRTTETYVQAINATSAQFSNTQAQNSKKLTGFAAIFVPASLCAAILAIPSFSPDAKSPVKFWVFWAVSVPLAIILAVWFLSPLPQWLNDQRAAWHIYRAPEVIQEKVEAAPTGAEVFAMTPRRRTWLNLCIPWRRNGAGRSAVNV
ncbi:hypothetical protein K458DRAFT_75582 [Lentithecium fluviatile CBS 122367]|uniref:Cora-domain-containing protein n=1 Tax=Lentithecium fluviatile CBS 122367 TaxID=1168545 RepID=A0A6G1IVD3_9PLEO|nr:hypothetical protein K458DRAFT_75582 [Lentithecium fluviatile CBS 122367]